MLAAMLSVLLFGSGESDLDRRQRDIDTIRLTYQANKESFSAGEFHFTQIQGRANSVEEAKQ